MSLPTRAVSGYLYKMVTQNMLRTHEGIYVFSVNRSRFVTALNLINCLKQMKWQRLLLTCKPISGVPSSIYKYHVMPIIYEWLIHKTGLWNWILIILLHSQYDSEYRDIVKRGRCLIRRVQRIYARGCFEFTFVGMVAPPPLANNLKNFLVVCLSLMHMHMYYKWKPQVDLLWNKYGIM